MPVVHNPASEYSKEMWQWNNPVTATHPEFDNLRGFRPAGFQQYPRMLYKAQKTPNGPYACMLPAPSPYGYANAGDYERACLHVDHFAKACQRIVRSESEERDAAREGWKQTPKEALDYAEGLEKDMGQAAAEAMAAAQRMSAGARAELERAEEAAAETLGHATDVTPKKKGER